MAVPEVVVSRYEARVTFPPEVRAPFTFDSAGATQILYWSILVPETAGPLRFSGRIGRVPPPLTFPSLDSLLRVGWAGSCSIHSQFGGCSTEGSSISASRGRVVLTSRDSAEIARLFGLRPDSVTYISRRIGDTTHVRGSVSVRYVDPQIPVPDSAAIRRRWQDIANYERSTRSVRRHIAFQSPANVEVSGWIEVGDSVQARVSEMRMFSDVGGRHLLRHGDWNIDDSTVARIRMVSGSPEYRREYAMNPLPLWAVAEREGRTILRAHNIAPYSGPLPRELPPLELATEIVVIPRLGSVRVFVQTDTAVLGTTFMVRTEARDQVGRLIPGVPISVVRGASLSTIADSGRLYFSGTGERMVVVRFGNLFDSVRVTVLPP